MFDREFYSCWLGIAKPDAAYFLAILHAIQLPPEQVLFIDDHQINVSAARDVGLHAIEFSVESGLNRLNQHLAEFGLRPQLTNAEGLQSAARLGLADLVIRRYESGDQAAVWKLHQLGLDQVGVDAGPGPWDDDLQDIAGVYLNARGEFLAGLLEGWVVAMGAFRRTSERRALVKRMRVHRDVQRRGFGQQILDALERRAATLGYRELHLDTTAKQDAARSLYVKNGYVEVGRRPWRDTEIVLYEKTLGSGSLGASSTGTRD